MKKIIIIMFMSILLVGCENNIKPSINSNEPISNIDNEEIENLTDDIIEEPIKETSIKVGKSTLYFGEYKGIFDANGWKATITINDDKTATYVGTMDVNGKKEVNLTGTYEVEAEKITMSDFDSNKYDGIFFSWSNGKNESYAIGDKMFGDQWHSFKLK